MQYKNLIHEDFKYTLLDSSKKIKSILCRCGHFWEEWSGHILNGLSMTTKIVMYPKEGGKSGKIPWQLGVGRDRLDRPTEVYSLIDIHKIRFGLVCSVKRLDRFFKIYLNKLVLDFLKNLLNLSDQFIYIQNNNK